MILPSFLLIGAQKAGTTALASFLRQHPEVCFSQPKETWFFDRRYERGIEWLASHFKHWNGEPAIGEGTARLLANREAPFRIYDHIPDVQLLCILRNPIERAFSQYYFYLYTGKTDTNKSFGELIRRQDTKLGRDLVNQGRYIDHLRRYEEVFGRDQLTIVFHQTFRQNPALVLQVLYEAIGVDPAFQPDTESKHNVTEYPTSQEAYAALRRAWHSVQTHVERYAPGAAKTLRRVARHVLFDTTKPSMEDEDRAFLREVYKQPIRELELWLDEDLSHWT
jgi:hypothetical protein